MTDYFADNPTAIDATLQSLYFDAMQFCRIAESFGSHSLFDTTLHTANSRSTGVFCVRNIVPAAFLQPRFQAAHTVVLFSATLNPPHFFRDLLGLPEQTAWLDIDSPFGPEQLTVRVVDRVSTRFAQRAASLAPIAELMAAQFERQPGNYLAFFSSFDYLQQVAAELGRLAPQITRYQQSPRMGEHERAAFLAQFTPSSRGIGFAVLGGAFGEGIDLPGERLIGAFIATLGLPQLNPVNEQFRQQMQRLFGAGYDYTYLYPGLQKVIQAAGRVIRTPQDRGTVFLIDDRFARPDIARLLPGWWSAPAGALHRNTARYS